MAKNEMITKRLAIDKANAQVVLFTAIAAFVSVFCLVAAQGLFSQNAYLQKVIDQKNKAKTQLQKNIVAASNLSSSYQAFLSTPTNIIGGNPTGTGNNDGDNAKIVLDALPSTYDFPALTSSIEKILNGMNLKIGSIGGTDEAQTQQTSSAASSSPQAETMPFSFTVQDANYGTVQQLITLLQQSIRPLQVDTIDMSGNNSNMTLSVTAHTYFQPAKGVNISKKVVK